MGEWATWAMLALGLVSLLRFIPYGWFRKSHKAFPVVLLIGAAHTVVMLLRERLLTTPFGVLILGICVMGGAVAVISLAGMTGRGRQYSGHVVEAVNEEAGVLGLTIRPDARWPGHVAGQFALLTLDPAEGPHPFSIVSHWQPGAPLRFAIKPLGDYTRTLSGRIHPGHIVSIEGPYGRFDFDDGTGEQVWVAGGIGVAPFLARLEALTSGDGARSSVHFFHCVKSMREASFPRDMAALCHKAGVNLHQHIDERDGLMSAEDIGKFVNREKSVWFCGPKAWGESLRLALSRNHGLRPERFHCESFEFR
jgi:predicted ferric reductase